jgi:hypothetical protein
MHETLRVILELEPDVSPIRGLVGPDDGQACRFDGYVQLIGHLEALQGRVPATGSPARPGTTTDLRPLDTDQTA